MVVTLGQQYYVGKKPTVILYVVVSHIQRIGCQPEKSTLHSGQSRSWSAGQRKENKRKSLAAPPSAPTLLVRRRNINKIKITRRIYIPRRYAGLGPSRVRARIPSTRRLGQSLRKILRFHVRKQLSQSRCLYLLLAMSSRVYLFFPPRGHEPPPTLRDRINPHLSL